MQGVSNKTRNSTYDILKLLLALMVILSHSWELLGTEATGGIQLLRLFNRSPGNVAVHAFFALSGYFITMSCHRAKSMGDYLWKRVIRIFPAYILAINISYLLGKYCNNFSELPTPHILNGCVWTLYYEIVLYLCVALMKTYNLLRKEIVGAIGSVLFLVAVANVQNTDATYSIVLPMLFMFVFGSYVYIANAEDTVERMGIWSLLGLLIIQFFPGVFTLIGKEFPLIYGPDLSTSLLLAIYLFSLPTVILWLGQIIKISLLHFPDLSYGVYLFGWPIQQGIIYYFFVMKNQTISPLLLFILSTIASLIVAAISWYVMEKNFLKTKNWYWKASEKAKQAMKQWKEKHR